MRYDQRRQLGYMSANKLILECHDRMTQEGAAEEFILYNLILASTSVFPLPHIPPSLHKVIDSISDRYPNAIENLVDMVY